MKKTAKLVALAALPLLFLSGCITDTPKPNYKVELEVWDLFGDNSSYSAVNEAFRTINPNVTKIKYRKLTINDYKQNLIEAMASRQEPAVFLIHNTWLPDFKNRVAPVPKNILTEQEFRKNFPDVVAADFLDEGNIYALPLSVDSLALFYNKDIFNSEGITAPPATWEEFNDYAKKFTRIDDFGNITVSGAAMGTAYNINRSTDILGMLMMQKKVVMSDKKRVSFADPVIINGESARAGEEALEYFTQFARSDSSLYTWNPLLHWSIDAFSEGTAAMIFSYSWNYETVKSKNAKLNFAVAPVPQAYPEAPANYANYWAFAVAKNKEKNEVHEAWQYLKFLTTRNSGSFKLIDAASGAAKVAPLPNNFDPAKIYLGLKKAPAARLDIIEEQKGDYILGPFAAGNLVAKSWYQKTPEKTEAVLAEAINSVNIGSATVKDALDVANNRVSQLIKE